MSRRTRLEILGQAGLFLTTYGCLVALIAALLSQSDRSLAAATLWALTIAQAVSVVVLSIVLIARKAIRASAAARSKRISESLREMIANWLSGNEARLVELRAAAELHRTVMRESLVEMLPALKGEGRQALSALASELGYIREWEGALASSNREHRRWAASSLAAIAPEYAAAARTVMIRSSDPELRLTGARMMARAGTPEELLCVLERFHKASLFERALLAEDLRPSAALLCETALPAVLASEDNERILRSLEILDAWKRNIQLPVLHRLLVHRDPGIRAAALRVLPYEADARAATPAVVELLSDEHADVRTAAAFAAGRLQLEPSLAALEKGLSDPDAETARSCAYAMAHFGSPGLDGLERQVVALQGRPAAIAMEAIESARTGHIGSVV